jgi:RNA polymerase sigma-70 factor (ECF subfamily)
MQSSRHSSPIVSSRSKFEDEGRFGDRLGRLGTIGRVQRRVATLLASELPRASTTPISGVSPTEGPSPVELAELVLEHADFVFRSLRRLGLGVAEAEDCAQQVFLVAGQKISTIQRGKERAFLFGTVKNLAAEFRRRSARRAEIELVEASMEDALAIESSLDEELDQKRARALLDEVLAAMPEKYREVFVLSEIEELSATEVGLCLDIPPGTVASRLARSREVFDETLNRIQKRRAFRGQS